MIQVQYFMEQLRYANLARGAPLDGLQREDVKLQQVT